MSKPSNLKTPKPAQCACCGKRNYNPIHNMEIVELSKAHLGDDVLVCESCIDRNTFDELLVKLTANRK